VRFTSFFVALIFSLQSALCFGQGQQNGDLFPNIRDNPTVGNGNNGAGNGQGPITIDEGDDDADLPFIPGTGPGTGPGVGPGRPGGGNGVLLPLPGGGFDGGVGRPTIGIDPPVQNGQIRIAQVPGQYSCPLFENNSYQDLNVAIANLTNAIQNVADECRSSQHQVQNLRTTNDEIRKSVEALQGFVSNPATAYQSAQDLQTNVTTLVTGIDRMADVFRNATTLSNSCGRRVMSWGRVALELSNVVNSASPFLLLLLAVNPALSLTVKSTIMGGVVASNVVSALSQVIASNSVDMNNSEQRNAVLQNTCQYTKVARKIRYIQLAQSGRFAQLEKELNESVKTYSLQMFGNMSAEFGNMMTMRNGVRNNIGAIQANVRIDREALNELNQQIREAQGNALLVCLKGQELSLVSQDPRSFPNTVTQSILDAYQQQLYLKNIDMTEFEFNFGNRGTSQDEKDIQLKKRVQNLISTYQKLLAILTSFESPPKQDQIPQCATVTMTMAKHIETMIRETSKIMVDDLEKFEEELAKNEEYRKWKEQFEKVTVEQENTKRMARVLKELTNAGAAVYNRSEFNESANALKRSLLGVRSGFFRMNGETPVFAWLDHKRRQFDRAIGSFHMSINTIRGRAFVLTKTGRGENYGKSTADSNRQLSQDMNLVQDLRILTPKTLPKNSQQWELACIDLEKAIKDYSEALDHLGATNFMCDLIFDHLDNAVDPRIIRYCRGVADYSGVQSESNRSAIDKALASLKKRPAVNRLSYHELSNIVARKMTELQCPLPRAAEAVP